MITCSGDMRPRSANEGPLRPSLLLVVDEDESRRTRKPSLKLSRFYSIEIDFPSLVTFDWRRPIEHHHIHMITHYELHTEDGKMMFSVAAVAAADLSQREHTTPVVDCGVGDLVCVRLPLPGFARSLLLPPPLLRIPFQSSTNPTQTKRILPSRTCNTAPGFMDFAGHRFMHTEIRCTVVWFTPPNRQLPEATGFVYCTNRHYSSHKSSPAVHFFACFVVTAVCRRPSAAWPGTAVARAMLASMVPKPKEKYRTDERGRTANDAAVRRSTSTRTWSQT